MTFILFPFQSNHPEQMTETVKTMYFKAYCPIINEVFAKKQISSQSECNRAKNISIFLVRYPDSVHLTQLLLHVYKGSEGVRSSR